MFQSATVRQHLTFPQSAHGGFVGQVQLEINVLTPFKCVLAILRYEIPHACVRYVDSAKQISRWVAFHEPQK